MVQLTLTTILYLSFQLETLPSVDSTPKLSRMNPLLLPFSYLAHIFLDMCHRTPYA